MLVRLPNNFVTDPIVGRNKPTVPIRIKDNLFNHPLRYVYMLGEQIEPFNMAVPAEGSSVKDGTDALLIDHTTFGSVLDFVNIAGSSSTASARLELEPPGAMAQGFVVADFFTDVFDAGDVYVLAHGDTVGAARIYFGVRGSNIFTRLGSGAAELSTRTVAVGERLRVLLTWSNGNAAVYINGEKDSTYSFTGTPGSDLADSTTIGMFRRSDSLFLDAFDGKVASLFIGEDEITDYFAKSLTNSPYQIFEPSFPPLYFTPEVAGRVMSSLAGAGGLAYRGGIAGRGGGLAG